MQINVNFLQHRAAEFFAMQVVMKIERSRSRSAELKNMSILDRIGGKPLSLSSERAEGDREVRSCYRETKWLWRSDFKT